MISASNAINAYMRAADIAVPASSPRTTLSDTAGSFEQVMAAVDQAAIGAMSGTTDTHVLVQSLTEAELALNAAVAIRDKVVEAYQEILRMPV
ncbi:MAG: flagellar hook-basal body complex protein FliE [Paracoccus sp. (in: a-proteobacteria)]